MSALLAILLFLITTSIIFYIICIVSTIRFFGNKQDENNNFNQPVSLLIPVCGLEDGAQEIWAGFCQQDYENYEVIFGVMSPSDPAIPVLKEVVAQFSDRAKLICDLPALGVNHKTSNLIYMVAAAQHEIVIFADSDMRVTSDYIRAVTAPLANPEVGIVTCGYVDHAPKSLGAALASMGRCIDFIPSVLVASSLYGGLRFALGATIVTRKSVLDKFGGLQKIVNRIGFDYHIGKIATEVGYRVELSKYIIDNDYGYETTNQVFQRELRWARTIRLNKGSDYYGLIFGYGTTYALALLLISGFQPWAIIVCLTTFGIRTLQAIAAIQSLGCPKLGQWLWILPFRDILSFIIWVGGSFGQKVNWRGRQLRVGVDGTLTE